MPTVTKYIYAMQRVRKAHQDKLILDEVTLAFLPGAKIGVVGPNGAGKSTVLKIMAGLETISNGEAALAPGASVGILLQEPGVEDAVEDRRAVRSREPGQLRRCVQLAARQAAHGQEPVAQVALEQRHRALL